MTYDNWLFYLEIDFYLTLKGSGGGGGGGV